MVAVSRRSFVEKLGLGMGATFLSPLVRVLVNEAHGQPQDRKIAVFFLLANGMHWLWNFTPAEFLTSPTDPVQTLAPVLNGPTNFAWPNMFKPLEPYRGRMLLMDGLCNENRVGGDGGHSMRFGALSCRPSGNGQNPEAGTPGGTTIDQFIANRISTQTPRKSVLIGISAKPEPMYASVFAAAKDRPEPQVQSPQMLFGDIFGASAADAAGVNRGGARQRLLFDTMRADINRMEKSFVGAERAKLMTYLTTMEDFERRQKALGLLGCKAPAAPGPAQEATPEDKLESLHSMATLALACGITNVMGVALGCGFSHDTFPELKRILVGTPYEKTRWDGQWSGIGHQSKEVRQPIMDLVYQWGSKMIAGTIETLAAIKVGDRTLFDNSLMLYTSENGEDHHARHGHWPLALIGNAGGKLKVDGRFLRYPPKGKPGFRSMGDLYCSMATALGAPTNDFGKGGNEIVTGPLDLLG